tara:strand:+ start:548 stop:910 length:363 start_codon:yes stop_codon:yes gene_type:complete
MPMKKIKKLSLMLLFSVVITSCGGSDVVVQIYGAYEYNCTTNEYRVLSKNVILPFMKKNKWYTKEEFHEAHVEHTLEPYKNIPMSDSSLAKITPTKETSDAMLGELIMDVDCENPQDIKF